MSESASRPLLRAWVGLSLLLAAAGCDDAATIPDVAPEVVFEGWCRGGERTYLSLRLLHTERADFDLQIRLEGNLEGTVAPGVTGSGIQGLGSDVAPVGQRHLIEWGAACGDPETCVDPCAALARLDLPGPAVQCTTLPAAIIEPLSVRVYLRHGDEDYAAPVLAEAPVPLPALGQCPRP